MPDAILNGWAKQDAMKSKNTNKVAAKIDDDDVVTVSKGKGKKRARNLSYSSSEGGGTASHLKRNKGMLLYLKLLILLPPHLLCSKNRIYLKN